MQGFKIYYQMKKLIKKSNQKSNHALSNFAKLQLSKDQQSKLKGGGGGDGSDNIIIVEDVVVG